MKKVVFFCLCSILPYQLLAQPFEKKQLTNFNYDSRGAVFPIFPSWLTYMQISPIFFEAHEGSSSNIMLMNYDSSTDSFFNPMPITSGNFKNINPIADAFFNVIMESGINLIWQTNENGNWDIALKTLKDSVWGEKEYIINSQADEINPKFVLGNDWNSQNNYEIEFVYEKENSVYLYQRKDSTINHEIVFSGNDTLQYSQPTGIHFSGQPNTPEGLYIAATCKPNDGTSVIVIRFKASTDSIWSPIYKVYDSGYCENPKFCNPYFYFPFMSFERTNQHKQVYIIRELEYFGQIPNAVTLIDDEDVSTSDFNCFVYGIVGELNKGRGYDFYGPHSYKLVSNDSVYVVRPQSYRNLYETFFTKVSDTKIGLGNLGYEYWEAISYIIWEDSANGHINLFGVKRLDAIGDVNDKIVMENFTLYQNYPNSFNPKTVIKYNLLFRDFVTLKVFDVLGNEISTLINEEKSAGEYSQVFDGSNLASGIYMYRLLAGNHHLSRKMILLK